MSSDEPKQRSQSQRLPPLDDAGLRVRLGGLARTHVAAPRIDRALLDDRGEQTYAWIESGDIVAIGPSYGDVVAASKPYPVERPPWQETWRELTAPGANPWRPPSEPELHHLFHASLHRTFAAAPGDHHGHRHPLAAVRAAVDEWARDESRYLGGRLMAAAAGESRPLDGNALRGLLGELSRRHGVLPGAALVPLVLGELLDGPAVQIWPTPPLLSFDIIGRAGDGHVRVRAAPVRGSAVSWTAIDGHGADRHPTLFEGGDVVLSLIAT